MSNQQAKNGAAYRAGFNKGLTGVATTTNCNFRHFSTPEKTADWELGVKDGEAARASAKQARNVKRSPR